MNFHIFRDAGQTPVLHWVFEAKKRLGLSVLNYTVTSNHIHLLVNDTGSDVIAQSMQLIAGRIAQEYNQCKGRWRTRCRHCILSSREKAAVRRPPTGAAKVRCGSEILWREDSSK